MYRIIGEERKKLNYYVVEDKSDQECRKFAIAQYDTVVTEDRITVRGFGQTITLVLDAGDKTFAFYQELFPLGDDFVSINHH